MFQRKTPLPLPRRRTGMVPIDGKFAVRAQSPRSHAGNEAATAYARTEMLRLLLPVLFLLSASATAQATETPPSSPPPILSPTDTPETLEQLAAKVELAHYPLGKQPAVTAFAASILMQELGRNQSHRVDAELEVKFLMWQKSDSRPWPLLRFQVLDAATRIEQGRDRNDYWGLIEGKPVDLSGKDYEQDRQDCRRHLKLAQQMVQFLSPATVLRSLKKPSAVSLGELKLGRSPSPFACWIVSGELAAFPLRSQPGENVAVMLKAYVDKTSGLLMGLLVQPTAGEDQSVKAGEFLYFSEHAPEAGRIVPRTITHFDVTKDQQKLVQLKMTITTLLLDGKLNVNDFDRPAK